MSEIANSEGASETEKPVKSEVQFPPFPDPKDEDFDDAISEEERSYYKSKFKDLNTIKNYKLHCTACDRHMGCSPRNERIRVHPLLHTLICHVCHAFYNSGEFEKGDDGSELYCRWCGQGGQVYCCSDCPHVFCAKCIKRNLGVLKIKEIENADDWKCFRCNPDCLKDLRAVCWAVLRYCDLKQKVTNKTQDPELKAAYERDCSIDPSECCKHKATRKSLKQNESSNKKKEIKKEPDSKTNTITMPKIPSTIQVKKFASVNLEETTKPDKKAQKRSASPKLKPIMVKNPVAIAPCPKVLTPVAMPPLAKKMRFPSCNTPIRYQTAQDRKQVNTYTRARPPKLTPLSNNYFNGFATNMFQCANPINDNINLSLESLTQGLDMAAVAAMSANTLSQNDDVVCTPDFPLEPMCEVTEDNDDDVQCITPAPVATTKITTPTPFPTITIPRAVPNAPEVTPDNIIQMTENDVTVNENTGGLKFRVDPQTLSSNKMYRLPDGRIFAINANPNMPGGYSATIVAVTEANKAVPKGTTFAAKLSSVSASTSTPKPKRNQVTRVVHSKRTSPKNAHRKPSKTSGESSRECDMSVPVEWYRYNLIDAVDAVEYSLSRLNRLKKEATSVYLRTRSINEMRSLHRTLERLLNTASTRFNEIRDNLNKGLKEYSAKKAQASEDEDDDVEILPDIDDDPIFIDENSTESNINGDNQEVDLTSAGNSEYNDSGENRTDNFNTDVHGEIVNVNNRNDNLIENLRRKEKPGNNKRKADINCIQVRQNDGTTTLIDDDLKFNEPFVENDTNEREKDQDINALEINTNETVHKLALDNKKENMTNTIHDCDADISDKKSHETAVDNENMTKKIYDCEDDTSDNKSRSDVNKERDAIQDTDTITQDANDEGRDAVSDLKDSDKNLISANNTMQDIDDKIQDTDDKLKNQDVKVEDVDHEMADAADSIGGTDWKSLDSDDKIQDTVKIEDVDDKVQDTEMSEDLIETLLKDDSVDNITSSSDVPTLQVN